MKNYADQLRAIADRILKHLPLEEAHNVDELYHIAGKLDKMEASAADDGGGSNPKPPPPPPPPGN